MKEKYLESSFYSQTIKQAWFIYFWGKLLALFGFFKKRLWSDMRIQLGGLCLLISNCDMLCIQLNVYISVLIKSGSRAAMGSSRRTAHSIYGDLFVSIRIQCMCLHY